MVRILQEVKAKAYQSTATAAAMENAVEQTSKCVFNNLVLRNLLTDRIQRLLRRTTGRSCCLLCMEILFLKIRFWFCRHAFILLLVVLCSHLIVLGRVWLVYPTYHSM
jgi:hypothetical protein